VVIIEQDPNCRFLNTARSAKIPVIYGDATLAATLEAANVNRALGLLAVTSDDTINLEIALSAKSLVATLPVVVRNQDPHFAAMTQQVFDFEAVLSPTDLAAPAFAATALGGRILGSGMTAEILWIALAVLITPNHPFCGASVKQAAMAADIVPLYLEQSSGATLHGWSLLETTLTTGDVLYLTLPAHRLDQLWQALPSPFAH
jgi:voltage-gated potassium channel Kch